MRLFQAAALIAEIDPRMGDMFVSRPFHRRAVVSALFAGMNKDDGYFAYRVRVLLTRALDEADRERQLEEEAQL